MARLHRWGSIVLTLQSHYKEKVYFFYYKPQEFLGLLLLTSEGSKAESTTYSQ